MHRRPIGVRTNIAVPLVPESFTPVIVLAGVQMVFLNILIQRWQCSIHRRPIGVMANIAVPIVVEAFTSVFVLAAVRGVFLDMSVLFIIPYRDFLVSDRMSVCITTCGLPHVRVTQG